MKSPEAIASALLAKGAILTLVGPPRQRILVRELRWSSANSILWFTSPGNGGATGRKLEFDAARVADPETVTFYQEGRCVARLTSIDEADVENPEDYRAAVARWQKGRKAGPTQPTITEIEIEALMSQVALGAVTPRTALSLLVINGIDRPAAAKHVFHALGGRDSMYIDGSGRARYAASGKLVLEVEREIAEAMKAPPDGSVGSTPSGR